jgi:small subunit ribosomal protein S11
MVKQLKRPTKQKLKFVGGVGQINIKSTFNNTLINVNDKNGNTRFFAAAGNCGFKGKKKSTPFAAESIARKIGFLAANQGLKHARVKYDGPGKGCEAALTILSNFFKCVIIRSKKPQPHNGCRTSKPRRL